MQVITAKIEGKRVPIVLLERECEFCKRIFQPKQQRTRFCSGLCSRRQYKKDNPSEDKKYKDKIRHGGKREELIKENGFKCVKCGKEGNSYQIVAHHITFNNQDHSEQELLCRACHCRLHHSNEKKPLTREQIDGAIKSSPNLFEACKELGLNRSSLYQKRRKLGLV